jgi:hypothetical protein
LTSAPANQPQVAAKLQPLELLAHKGAGGLTGRAPATASFVYDADGARVKAVFGGTTMIYVGSHYEKTGATVTKTY